MKIGIVLLNYKDYKMTEAAANMACRLPIDYVVVIDNNSPNNSAVELAKLHHRKLTFIASSQNKGYSAGNNIGIKYLLDNTDCDIIGVVNPDVIIDKTFVLQIKDDFAKSDFSVLTGVQYKPNKHISDRAFWPRLSKKDVLCSNSIILTRLFGKNNYTYVKKKLSVKEKNIIEIDTVEGCCFFIRANDLKEIGLLDESTFLFFEEDILSKKLAAVGKKIGVDKRISFLHNHSKTIRSIYSQRQMDKLLFHSRGIFFRKYMAENTIDKIIYTFSELMFYLENPLWYVYQRGKCFIYNGRDKI